MRTFAAIGLAAAAAVCAPSAGFAEDLAITAEEHAACDADAMRLCMSAYPNVDRMIRCMVSNRAKLTSICLKTFDEGLKRRHIVIPTIAASR